MSTEPISKTDTSRQIAITTPGFLCAVGIHRLSASWPGLDTVGEPCGSKLVNWDMVVGSEPGEPELGRETVSGSGEAEPEFAPVELESGVDVTF